MTALNKQALRKLVKALSGKEWVAFVHKASGTYAVGSLGHERGEDIIKWPGLDGQDNAEIKAKFIAAANPATVLALLDELEKSQAQSSKWCEAFHKAVSIGARYEERIAELEARTVTLPTPYPKGYGLVSDKYNFALEECADAIRSAGIGVKGN
ncbi:ead/Ea22-like family protein [Citrobacter freundii]|uniref:ead/Ea22-like family protein n=1 Tax=Citrobacter freundii TaxID=546 RepID=UPI001BD1415B|nr:ead/Ea22-like family protein [Citrobacter freundii]